MECANQWIASTSLFLHHGFISRSKIVSMPTHLLVTCLAPNETYTWIEIHTMYMFTLFGLDIINPE